MITITNNLNLPTVVLLDDVTDTNITSLVESFYSNENTNCYDNINSILNLHNIPIETKTRFVFDKMYNEPYIDNYDSTSLIIFLSYEMNGKQYYCFPQSFLRFNIIYLEGVDNGFKIPLFIAFNITQIVYQINLHSNKILTCDNLSNDELDMIYNSLTKNIEILVDLHMSYNLVSDFLMRNVLNDILNNKELNMNDILDDFIKIYNICNCSLFMLAINNHIQPLVFDVFYGNYNRDVIKFYTNNSSKIVKLSDSELYNIHTNYNNIISRFNDSNVNPNNLMFLILLNCAHYNINVLFIHNNYKLLMYDKITKFVSYANSCNVDVQFVNNISEAFFVA